MFAARHLPNAITVARGLCGFGVAALLVAWEANLAAFMLYIAAIATDLVDGALARRLGAESQLGLVLDPVADKVLSGATWLALLAIGWAPAWLAAPILLRDAIVMIAWIVLLVYGETAPTTLIGRLMVSFEGVALPLLLLHVEWMGVHWMSAGVILGVIALALSLVSAAQYVVHLARHAR